MKRLMMVALLGMLTVVGVIGCATAPGAQPQPPTAAQVKAYADAACPSLDMIHTQLVAFNTSLEATPSTAKFGTNANAQLAVIDPLVKRVCNGSLAAATVDLSSVQALVTTGLPALGTLVGTLPLPPAQAAQVQAGLVLAETAAGLVRMVQANAAANTVPAPASSTSPAQ